MAIINTQSPAAARKEQAAKLQGKACPTAEKQRILGLAVDYAICKTEGAILEGLIEDALIEARKRGYLAAAYAICQDAWVVWKYLKETAKGVVPDHIGDDLVLAANRWLASSPEKDDISNAKRQAFYKARNKAKLTDEERAALTGKGGTKKGQKKGPKAASAPKPATEPAKAEKLVTPRVENVTDFFSGTRERLIADVKYVEANRRDHVAKTMQPAVAAWLDKLCELRKEWDALAAECNK